MTPTNEAGHGLPELPEPWTIRYHDDATGCEVGPPTPVYTADQMQQYAIDYAATLALSRGVPEHPRYFASGPEGCFYTEDMHLAEKIVNRIDFDDDWTITDLSNPTGTAPSAPAEAEINELRAELARIEENGTPWVPELLEWLEKHDCCPTLPFTDYELIDALETRFGEAAPAAAGAQGEDGCGACGNGCKDRAGCELAEQSPPIPQPAAADGGVRARALEMLSQAYREAGFEKAATWVLQVDLDSELYVLDRAVVGAIEAALSSHRQAGDGLSKFRELAERAYEVVHHDDGCAAIGGNGDKDCRCDAVPFLRDMESLLALVEKGAGNG